MIFLLFVEMIDTSSQFATMMRRPLARLMGLQRGELTTPKRLLVEEEAVWRRYWSRTGIFLEEVFFLLKFTKFSIFSIVACQNLSSKTSQN